MVQEWGGNNRSLRLRKTAGSPVPPPRATTLSSESFEEYLEGTYDAVSVVRGASMAINTRLS